jgi:hypothetical protein
MGSRASLDSKKGKISNPCHILTLGFLDLMKKKGVMASLFCVIGHPFNQQSASRQVQSLFQSQLSTQCDLELPTSDVSILSLP